MSNAVLYNGPSTFDGAPIAAVLNGIDHPSRNPKTGPMAQVWIIRSDMHPTEALKSKADVSVCQFCPLRGTVCYVKPVRGGPAAAYRGLELYGPPTPRTFRARPTRIGAYGNPSSIHFQVWEQFDFHRVTSYEHNWRNVPVEFSEFCMASVSSPEEREEAKALGYRTFRIRQPGDPILKGEAQCPASKEMGKKLQCIDCMMCNGNARGFRGDITILQH